MKQAKGKDFLFISRILKDGSGVEEIDNQEDIAHLNKTHFDLVRLSISNDTYIADNGFNCYVVRLKEKP